VIRDRTAGADTGRFLGIRAQCRDGDACKYHGLRSVEELGRRTGQARRGNNCVSLGRDFDPGVLGTISDWMTSSERVDTR